MMSLSSRPDRGPLTALARRSSGSVAVVCLTLLLVLSACAGDPLGPTAMRSGDAVDTATLEDRAATALQTGRFDQARQLYRSLVQRNPENAAAVAGLAETERLRGEYDAALRHATMVLESAGASATIEAQALFTAGSVLLAKGESEAAERRLRRAVELDATNWRAWNALGQTLDQRRSWTEAEVAYRKALGLAPNEPAVLNNFGVSRLSAGDLAGAAELFARARQLAPDLKPVETNLRLALALQGRYDAALAGTGTEQTPEALNNVGYGALIRGDYPTARAFFSQAIDASPSFYEPAWRNLRYLDTLEKRVTEVPAS
jgi:Flp pilus assembly protein TadD